MEENLSEDYKYLRLGKGFTLEQNNTEYASTAAIGWFNSKQIYV